MKEAIRVMIFNLFMVCIGIAAFFVRCRDAWANKSIKVASLLLVVSSAIPLFLTFHPIRTALAHYFWQVHPSIGAAAGGMYLTILIAGQITYRRQS